MESENRSKARPPFVVPGLIALTAVSISSAVIWSGRQNPNSTATEFEAPPDLNSSSSLAREKTPVRAGYRSEIMQGIYRHLIRNLHLTDGTAGFTKQLEELGLHLAAIEQINPETGTHIELRSSLPAIGLTSLSILIQSGAAETLDITRFEIYVIPDPLAFADAEMTFREMLGPSSGGLGENTGYRSWGLGDHQLWVERDDDPTPPMGRPTGTVGITYETVDETGDQDDVPPVPD